MQNITDYFGQKKNKFSSPFDFRSQQKNPKKVQNIDLNVIFIKRKKNMCGFA